MATLHRNTHVTFDPTTHTYTTQDGVQLSGITAMLHRQLFPDMYNNIPQTVLNKAAEHGSIVHDDIDFVDTFGGEPSTEEAAAYIELRKRYTPIANEYLVSNNISHASCIDGVWEDENSDIVLNDVKTTSKIHHEYLQWQLSVYAYLFELQNNGRKVAALYCTWLPKPQYGKPQLIPISRIPDEEIAKLIECDAKGEQYTPPAHIVTTNDNTLPSECRAIEKVLIEIVQQRKSAEEKEKKLREKLETLMLNYGVKKWETPRMTMTLKEETERVSIDTTRLKKEKPDIFNEYTKTTKVKQSILFTFKN